MWTLGPQVVECGGKAFQGQTALACLAFLSATKKNSFITLGPDCARQRSGICLNVSAQTQV